MFSLIRRLLNIPNDFIVAFIIDISKVYLCRLAVDLPRHNLTTDSQIFHLLCFVQFILNIGDIKRARILDF